MPKRKSPKKKAPRRSAARKPAAGHTLERGTQQFGEEVQKLGERLGARMERNGDEWDSWFHSTFGFLGPLVSSVFGLLILSLAIWALMFVNVPLASGFLSNMQAFLLVNLGMFFLIFLFFSYSSYFSKANPQAYIPLSPFVTAAGITIGFWVAFEVLRIVNLSLGNAALSIVGSWMYSCLFIIFWIALLIGYLALLVKLVSQNQLRKPTTVEPPVVAAKGPKAKAGRVHRLYRSGNDKILGGVCGGIAEYFAIDPTIIRLLWVVLTLMGWGSGIILYIILWIIVPRNPSHKWD